MNKIYVLLAASLLALSCSNEQKSGLQFSEKGRTVPEFNADSAYAFIQAQVDFGPRVPNTYGHVETRKYLERKFREYAGNQMVFAQEFTEEGYSGDDLKMANIIAAFNPTAEDRLMLSAHWDTRPRADMDTVRTAEYILGADDGGSGVGVLVELARVFSENPPPIGVDIVLFDGEDYGVPSDLDMYFLGSRYWSQNPPVAGYSPRFAILLDMVGAKTAQFPKEELSVGYAPDLVDEIWELADELGHSDLFLDELGASILDDHWVVNTQTDIRMINIINHRRNSEGEVELDDYWHTHRDNMDIISTETLQAVGEVLLELIYNRL
ncbi:MAG: M28 family peptidase [Balneolaceae bacterium]|nr:M28 family peptidase [Balneolaceae bacterium]